MTSRIPTDMVADRTSKAKLSDTLGSIQTSINTNTSSLADMATDINLQSDIVNAITKGVPLTLNIGKTINITSNLTIPNNITLKFNNGGKLSIASGVTLTINGYIDAGYYQIFSFADNTANVYTTNIGSGYLGNKTNVHYKIKVDWFGAIPDAAPPANIGSNLNAVPTGTDSSSGFRRAMTFAQQAAWKYNGGVQQNCRVVVEASPNGVYYVKGNNLLGLQTNTGYGDSASIEFQGNGCTILHQVLVSTDSLIANGNIMLYPIFSDFNVYTFCSTANSTRIGNFFNATVDNVANALRGPIFENICINDLQTVVPGYDKVFYIVGSNVDERGWVRSVHCCNFNEFFHCENTQAVNWLFQKLQLSSVTTNSTYFNCNNEITVEGMEFNLSKNGSTLFKTFGTQVDTNITYKFRDCRMETNGITTSDAFTLFNVQNGKLYVENIQFNNGNSVNLNPASRGLILGNNGVAKLYRCFLPQMQDIPLIKYSVSAITPPIRAYVIFDECGFRQNNAISLTNYPTINWLDENGNYKTTYQAFQGGYSLRNIQIKNPKEKYNNGEFDISVGSGLIQEQTVKLHQMGESLTTQTGDIYIPTGNILLPPDILITSIKLYVYGIPASIPAGNEQYVQVKVMDQSGTTNVIWNVNLNGQTSLVGQQVITAGNYISCPNSQLIINILDTSATVLTNQDKWYRGCIEITYRPTRTARDYSGTTPTSTSLVTIDV